MSFDHLSDHFQGVAAKHLSNVEANPSTSNQHEFNGVGALKRILGINRLKLESRHLYLGNDQEDVVTDTGSLTWYDAREAHPTRSEYRLYFSRTVVTDKMSTGDLLVVGRLVDGSVMVIVAQSGSTAENQIRWLFGLEANLFQFAAHPMEVDRELGFAARAILDELQIESKSQTEEWLETILDEFDGQFPKTAFFSQFARDTLPNEVSVLEDPDGALLAWLAHEEMLFKTLERHLVSQRLAQGFDDVDNFISYSLSIQNRRKSRTGYALEHHVETILQEHSLTYTRGGKTEGNSKPDFIFPGIVHYHDCSFPSARLTMLSAKSTCKERWRQVLVEVSRISTKHLLTLEPGISQDQTDEMQTHALQLVLPRELHDTYHPLQQNWLWDMKEFLSYATERQHM